MEIEFQYCILDGQHKERSELYQHLTQEYGNKVADRWLDTVSVDLSKVIVDDPISNYR